MHTIAKLYCLNRRVYTKYKTCEKLQIIHKLYKNVAKGIRLLDKKNIISFIQENFHSSKSFWKIYSLKGFLK